MARFKFIIIFKKPMFAYVYTNIIENTTARTSLTGCSVLQLQLECTSTQRTKFCGVD